MVPNLDLRGNVNSPCNHIEGNGYAHGKHIGIESLLDSSPVFSDTPTSRRVGDSSPGSTLLPPLDSQDSQGGYSLDNKKQLRANRKSWELKHLGRFVESHRSNLEISDYLLGHDDLENVSSVAYHLRQCGSYLLFVHDADADDSRLRGANFCRHHKLCTACAARRSVRSLQVYRPKLEELARLHPSGKYYFLTLTMRSMDDAGEMFDVMKAAVRDMFKAANGAARGKRNQSSLRGYVGGVTSFEVKRGQVGWHVHAHCLVMLEHPPNRSELIGEWASRVGQEYQETWNAHTDYGNDTDAFCKEIYADDSDSLSDAILEVFKYSVKLSDLTAGERVEVYRATHGRRFLQCYGALHALPVPEEDEPHDEEISLILHFYSRVNEHPERGLYQERCCAFDNVPMAHEIVATHRGDILCGCHRCEGEGRPVQSNWMTVEEIARAGPAF